MAAFPPPQFHTERLAYRAVDEKADVELFSKLNDDPMSVLQSSKDVARPVGKERAEAGVKWATGCLVGIVICLPQSPSERTVPGEAIGFCCLNAVPSFMAHHRKTDFGITMLPEYQGKGYGYEAMVWLLEQAFWRLGLNKVEGGTWAWNTHARKLYKRLGFVEEGIKRECLFQEGTWQDEVALGMLADEWREKYAPKKIEVKA